MYSSLERDQYFTEVTSKLRRLEKIEGIIQLGSGMKGYKDRYSDIDLMVAIQGDAHEAKEEIINLLSGMGAFYIKEGKFSEEIFLLIPFYENGLEMDISILPTHLLNVKSPLWQIIFDRTGKVETKMQIENEKFQAQPTPYKLQYDVVFEYYYHFRKLKIEVARGNFVYAIKMLVRGFTLDVQVLNEKKKLHQFKAYETLDTQFMEAMLKTYPIAIDGEGILKAANGLGDLFLKTLNEQHSISFDERLLRIAQF
ncbi:hypothetical protein MKZ17_00925 [Solibacillus sp. FSL R7-0682]|uniref:hypothetical protein n=1 Tax=Solibacillus sp. FSL R7-0682 TaxID=2921690 RepID=UPI0030F5FE18